MTEQTGENFNTSPELGFAFGRISLRTALDFLSSPELRGDSEAGDIGLHLGMIQDYFKDGASLYIWHTYADTVKTLLWAKESGHVSDTTQQKHREVADLLYREHTEFINDEAEDINRFLVEHPGVITRDTAGDVALQAVSSHHVPQPVDAARKGVPPVQTEAHWSDDTHTDTQQSTGLYVDMTALPEKYSRALHQYRILYDVDVNAV